MRSIFYVHFTLAHENDINVKSIFNKWYDEFAKKENEVDEKNGDSTIEEITTKVWEELIKPELHSHLLRVETKIESKITNWKQRTNLIECASFCQLLFDKNYFEKGATKIKTVNEFSMFKYGIDINIQLQSAKREDREKHKKLLNKYFS